MADAFKELFALLNLFCGGLLFLGLILYWLRSQERRSAVAIVLLLVVFACMLNSLLLLLVF